MVTTLDKNTALVIIDLQNGIAAFPVATPAKDIIANAARLASAFQQAGLPVVAVNVNPAGANWTKTRKDAQSPQMGAMSEDWFRIVPEIDAIPGNIYITKQSWSAFFNTPLHDELQKRSVTGIVLAGISTSIGVEGTARDASRLGYNIAFASDAMTDMFADAHAHSMKFIFPRIGETDTTENILAKLAER